MYINTYNLTGQALQDAWAHNNRLLAADLEHARRHTHWNTPWRVAVRRLIAYLAVRLDPAWLDASPDLLEGYLPLRWETLPHHELIAYLDEQDILPGNCILAE